MHKDPARSAREAQEECLIDIHYLWGVIIDSKALIFSLTLLGTLLAMAYSLVTTPVYQAEALIQIERNSGSDLFNELNSFLPEGNSSASSELVLIKSRSVLGKTAADSGLDIEVSQQHFPLLGKAFSRLSGQGDYSLDIGQFELPPGLLGVTFILTLTEDGAFILEGGGLAVSGKKGVVLHHGDVTFLLNNTNALPGTRFSLKKLSSFRATERIDKHFSVRESSKDSGMLLLSLQGDNPEKIRQILNVIGENYIEQNIARKSASAQNSLGFLEKQIPLVKSQLETAENRLSDFRRVHSSVDLTLEARSMLETGAAVNVQLNTLEFDEADLARLYTKAHPMYLALEAKKRDLLKTKASLENRINSMPTTQQDVLRLTRDVESAQAIYMQLLNKQQELNINKASTVGNVRVIDPAEVLPDPVHPRLVLIVLAGTVLGALSGIVLTLVRRFFKRTIVSSEQIQALGLHIYSSIPFSQPEKRQKEKVRNQNRADSGGVLVMRCPDDLATEAIRSLRTSLYFQLKVARNNILMVTGPTSQMGKSFVSSNLSVVFAQSGLRVLLVDADMRRGHLHTLFNLAESGGLTEILTGEAQPAECVSRTDIPGLDIISRGTTPKNPSELLLGNRFGELCSWAGQYYDLVVMDTPPILAVSDAAIMAAYAGMNLMVARFDITTSAELTYSIKRFEQEGHPVNGVVLNATLRRNSQYFQQGYYEYYQYDREHQK